MFSSFFLACPTVHLLVTPNRLLKVEVMHPRPKSMYIEISTATRRIVFDED